MKSTGVRYQRSSERLDEEHGVEVKPMTVGYCRFSVLERVLMVAVGVILVVTIVLAILYATKMSESDREGKKCQEDRRNTASELFQKSIEWSINPCNDFYKFSCSKWIESHDIPDTHTSLDQFSVLSEKNSEFIKAKLDNKEIIKKYEKNEAVSKALMDYFACMKADKMNDSLLVKFEQNIIKQYGSWNITDPNWRNSNWDLVTNLVTIHRSLPIITKPLFISSVREDQSDPSRHIPTITQTMSLFMYRMEYLSNDSNSLATQAMYKDLMLSVISVLANTSKDNPDIVRQVNDIYNFEAQLAEVEMPIEQARKFEENFKKITLKELQNYTGKAFNWLKYFQKLFAEIDVDINEEMYVAVYQLDYLRNMSEIIGNTDDVVLGNYLMWKVICSFRSYLSKKTAAEFNKFKRNILGTRQESRWQYCLHTTRAVLGLPLSVLYTDEKFNKSKLKHIEEMVSGIREIFVESIQNIPWMDPETKKEAVKKAKSITQNIGFPKILLDQKKLNKRYEELEINKDDFLGNVLRKLTYSNKKNFEKISQPVDKSEWSIDPDTTNAAYETSKHKIVFPAGILQAPFFDASRPKPLNYGAIGMVIGHELTHSFGNIGGNTDDWWRNKSIREFKTRTACLEKKYSGYTFHNLPVNGQRTLKENIADDGGIKQAFQAYKRWTKTNGDEPGFPSLNFTNDQLFFIGFAQTWCAKYRESEQVIKQVVEGGRHAPQKLRVIGSLSNFPEFSKAFNCSSGSRMNPVTKCNIWK